MKHNRQLAFPGVPHGLIHRVIEVEMLNSFSLDVDPRQTDYVSIPVCTAVLLTSARVVTL